MCVCVCVCVFIAAQFVGFLEYVDFISEEG